MKTIEERFWPKVDTSGDCWEWMASRTYGYGQFMLAPGKNQRAHRTAWELLVGPIPDGLTLDHLCRNRGCVNPDHLEPVTQAENTRRGYAVSVFNAAKTHCIRQHEFTPENTRITTTGARECRTCKRSHRAALKEKFWECPSCLRTFKLKGRRPHLLRMHPEVVSHVA